MNRIKIAMLVSKGDSSNIMYNALKDDFDVIGVFEDAAINKDILIKRRIKNLGLIKVIGQILFILYAKVLRKKHAVLISDLIRTLDLNTKSIPKELIKFEGNLNSKGVGETLNSLQPDIIVVNGTRILAVELLNSVKSHFINTHVGITPKYRGVHGGYWALTQNDIKNCGVTVHLVDPGIDTGGILFQDTITIDNQDNFFTYPIKQINKAIPLMKKAIVTCHSENIVLKEQSLETKLWHHPTLFEYLFFKFFKGIK
jgi:folate-dependent phosphoribosylglycinamide formyltransferase PurN